MVARVLADYGAGLAADGLPVSVALPSASESEGDRGEGEEEDAGHFLPDGL